MLFFFFRAVIMRTGAKKYFEDDVVVSLRVTNKIVGISASFSTLPPTIDPAVALHCFRSQRGVLLNLIRHCLPSLANSLLAENIIPQDLCERACNQCLGSGERGGAVLDCIEAAIQAVPSDFTAVVQILESERFLRSQAEKLVEIYCE